MFIDPHPYTFRGMPDWAIGALLDFASWDYRQEERFRRRLRRLDKLAARRGGLS